MKTRYPDERDRKVWSSYNVEFQLHVMLTSGSLDSCESRISSLEGMEPCPSVTRVNIWLMSVKAVEY